MNFLSPWYLLGALAIIAPVLLHLRRRPPKDFVAFSTLMFLDKTPERLTRRSKLERLWLLLLRCAVLLLLALLFARPFFDKDIAGAAKGEGRRLVVLLDRSASMQREDLWQRAQKLADNILNEASGRDEVVLATFDDRLTLLGESATEDDSDGQQAQAASGASFSRSTRVLQAQLQEVKAGWGGSDIGGALIAAADLLEATAAGGESGGGGLRATEIVLISDFQEGAQRDSLNSYAWPESVKVHCLLVEPKLTANLTLNLVATLREGEDDGENEGDDRVVAGDADAGKGNENGSLADGRRVRIRNSRADGEEVKFSLRWENSPTGADGGGTGAVVKGTVPPGASRVVAAPPREDTAAEGDGVLVLEGDGHEFDNRAWVARVQPRPIRVLYLAQKPDPQDPGTALFYLQRAMQPTSVLTPEVDSKAFSEVTDAEIDAAHVLVIAGAPEQRIAQRLGTAAEMGAAVFWLLRPGEDDATAAALAAASGIDGWKISEAKGGRSGSGDYAMLADLDFDSGVLAPFARAKVRDFSGIHVWKYRELTLPEDTDNAGGANVLARYDGGSPAWVQLQRGAGRMYLFTSGWEPAESQLALSSKFVPLLYAMLGEAGFSALAPPPLVVGEPLPLPVEPGAGLGGEATLTVKLPSGDSVESKVNEGVFRSTEQPGLHIVKHAAGESVYAVNLAAAEGRVDAFDPLVLADFSVPVLVDSDLANTEMVGASAAQRRVLAQREKAADDQRRMEKSEKEQRQKLWKWLVLAVLGVLLLETWVAGRSGKVTGLEPGGSEQAA